jgi:predicted RNA-binding Zn-ribbon protein involved in translation (DUF1610 family)
MIEKIKNQIKEREQEIAHLKEVLEDYKKPHYCQHCGKQIAKEYLPSYSCEKCVEEMVAKLPKHCLFGK